MTDLPIKNSFIQTFSTTNGVVDNDRLEFAKQTLLFDSVRKHTELVKHRGNYPTNTTTDVEFKLDVVVIDAHRYKHLLKLETELVNKL